ncbi:MAG TPA: hypothetical protein QGF35_06980 [Dehalococcoidia bacterium]|nr:hypothetical protein [Dehalococcoidia bacterium]
MLTKVDEYPVHQITDTFATVLSGDKHWNDGHYICLCDDAGDVSLVSTVRLYQNNDVLDGFVCIRHEGMQHNIRVSRRLRPEIDHYGAGPLRIEILEPMESIRLVLEENQYGISCDLVCHSVGVPFHGPLSALRIDGRLLLERMTYEIAGRVEGWIGVAGKRFELNHGNSGFFRNHSWGFLPGRGGPRLHGAPVENAPPTARGLRNWVLYTAKDHSGFYEFVEDEDGIQWSGAHRAVDGTLQRMTGAILNPDGQVPVTGVDHDLTFYDGTSRLSGGKIAIKDAAGTRREYEIEDMGWVYCQAGGYFGGFNDRLGQGVYRGDYHEEGEIWDCTHPVKIVDNGVELDFGTVLAESFVRLKSGDEIALAHFECAAFGPYPRYGLAGVGGS